MKCKKHKVDLVSFCPACMGSVKTKKKAKSSKLNLKPKKR